MYLNFILLFGISGGEIFIILLLILVLFGPKKIPEIARTFGKGINEIKKVQRDINAEIHRYSNEIENPAKEIKEDIEGFSKGLTYKDSKHAEETSGTKSSEADRTGEPDNDNADDLPYPYNQAGNVTENSADESKKTDDSPSDNNPSDQKKTE